MKKLLVVDCCIRGEVSRTKKLADAFLAALPEGEFAVERLLLGSLDLRPLDTSRYFAREALLNEGKLEDPLFDLARRLAAADLVLVAMPFWDMGIPAILKTYIEHVSISGITFGCDDKGNFGGLCKAKKMILLTTRGMAIPDGSEMEQASPYLKAVCSFFGIGGFEMISAWGTDVLPEEEVARRMDAAASKARALAAVLGTEI